MITLIWAKITWKEWNSLLHQYFQIFFVPDKLLMKKLYHKNKSSWNKHFGRLLLLLYCIWEKLNIFKIFFFRSLFLIAIAVPFCRYHSPIHPPTWPTTLTSPFNQLWFSQTCCYTLSRLLYFHCTLLAALVIFL